MFWCCPEHCTLHDQGQQPCRIQIASHSRLADTASQPLLLVALQAPQPQTKHLLGQLGTFMFLHWMATWSLPPETGFYG